MGAGLGFSNRLTGWGSFREAFVSSRAIVMRRFVLAAVTVLCVGTGSLVFGSASALAAPETPEVSVESPASATSVTVHGVLDPGKGGSPGTYELGRYEFLYSKTSNKTGCKGEGKAPSSPGISLGAGKESVSESLSGLEPSTEYAVCLVFHNELEEEAISSEMPFTTTALPLPLETPITTSPAAAITSSSATLTGVLNPSKTGEAGSYEFLYRALASECQGEGEEKSGGSALGNAKEDVSAEVGGLRANTQYTFCLLARNPTGETALGSPVTFTTLSASPTVEGEVVAKVGARSASVTAQVNPGGISTSYSVQYGTTTAYGLESPSTTVAAAANAAGVSLSGLQPNTEYHFRFIVTNKDGTVVGNDVAFTTYPPEVLGLPDGRVYELVSRFGGKDESADNSEVFVPAASRGGTDGSHFSEHPFEAAVNGSSVTFAGSPGSGGNGNDGFARGNQYLASRSSQEGWTVDNISVPANESSEYEAFSSDLSTGFVAARTEPPFVTTEAPGHLGGITAESENVNVNEVLYSRAFDESDYRPLFTKIPVSRSQYEFDAGDLFGGGVDSLFRGGSVSKPTQPLYAGSSADSSRSLFEVNENMLEGSGFTEAELTKDVDNERENREKASKIEEEAKKLDKEGRGSPEGRLKEAEARELSGTNDNPELYMSFDGELALVNVSPEGKVVPNATFGGAPPGARENGAGYNPGVNPSFDHDISADGSRIFWTSLETIAEIVEAEPENPKDELQEHPKAVYVREDGSRTVQVSLGPAEFWTASTDGKYAFYTEAGKLWRFDVENETRVELAGSGGGIQGVIGTNETGEDGTYVYFVTTEKLSSEEDAAKQEAVEGEDNAYVYEPDPGHAGSSRIVFIGTLAPEDSPDWTFNLGERKDNLTPDGHAFVFESHRNLTGSPYPSEGSEEVYVYDATDGSLHCASCRPQASGGDLEDSFNLLYAYRSVSEDGDQVFFSSNAPLVAQDVNGAQDVYEWERDGSGTCAEPAGCVYLLSHGVEGAATFVDASANGSDVFFVARQHLVPEDSTENGELYDARVDGTLPVKPPECTGTGCQGVPASAPIFATPASVTFNGVGNFPSPTTPTVRTGTKPKSLTRTQKLSKALKACRKKHQRKQRSTCEAHAHKLYGSKSKAKKSTNREGK